MPISNSNIDYSIFIHLTIQITAFRSIVKAVFSQINVYHTFWFLLIYILSGFCWLSSRGAQVQKAILSLQLMNIPIIHVFLVNEST